MLAKRFSVLLAGLAICLACDHRLGAHVMRVGPLSALLPSSCRPYTPKKDVGSLPVDFDACTTRSGGHASLMQFKFDDNVDGLKKAMALEQAAVEGLLEGESDTEVTRSMRPAQWPDDVRCRRRLSTAGCIGVHRSDSTVFVFAIQGESQPNVRKFVESVRLEGTAGGG